MKLLVFLSLLCVVSSEWHEITLDTHATVSFTVALVQNTIGVQELEDYVLEHLSNINSVHYGKYLSTKQILAYTQPDKNINSAVAEWLDFPCINMKDAFVCMGTVNQINAFFHTDLRRYKNTVNNAVKHTSITPYVIPYEMQDKVLFVDGLCNKLYPITKAKVFMKSGSNVDPGAVAREVYMRTYGITNTLTTGNVSVGAIEFQGAGDASNASLEYAQIQNNVTPNPLHTIGTPSIVVQRESSLDVQTMYWAANGAKLWFDATDSWMYSWAVSFFNLVNFPEVVSISWGWSETDQCSVAVCTNETSYQYINRANVEFLKITARGTTIVVSSGDAGSPERTNQFCDSTWNNMTGWSNMNPTFPAGSPWVLSVGATYLTTSDAVFEYTTPFCLNSTLQCSNGINEEGVSLEFVGWTSGSGYTHWTTRPTWQEAEVGAYLNSNIQKPDQKYFHRNNRAYPDVVSIGHNCAVYMLGEWLTIDGTSCSSPGFASIITHLNAFQKSRGRPVLGFANPLMYDMHRNDRATFNDIVVGNTTCTEYMCCGQEFGFLAREGWDSASGLGSPNVPSMLRFLVKYT